MTLSPDERGQTKVILDDIRVLHRVGDTHAWEHDGLFTFRSFSTSELEAVLLDREDLALFGENIIMRLLALKKRFSE